MCFSFLAYAIIENQLMESITLENKTTHIQDTGPADYKVNSKPTLMKVFALFNYLSTTSIYMAEGD